MAARSEELPGSKPKDIEMDRAFLLAAQRGDANTIRAMLEKNQVKSLDTLVTTKKVTALMLAARSKEGLEAVRVRPIE